MKRFKTWQTPKRLWSKLKPHARRMRHEPTPAEAVLWDSLRAKGLGGHRFRRQHPIDRFVVDFYCPDRKLIVEIDGAIHDFTAIEDTTRQSRLEALGYRVIRFRNYAVLHRLEEVLGEIKLALDNDCY